jgi:Tfp pilus assembly protein PilO
MNNKLTTKMYLFGGLSAAAILATSIFVLYPMFTSIDVLKQDIYDKRVQLAIYQQQQSNSEATRQDYNKIKNDTDNISKIFITKDTVLNLISSLESIAVQHSLKQDVKLDPVHQLGAGDKILGMQISLNGSWQNCLAYLLAVERLDYYILVNDIIVSAEHDSVNCILSTESYSL